jgi:hypothetical protein
MQSTFRNVGDKQCIKSVYFANGAADTIKPGYVFCFDRANGTAATAEDARGGTVIKPTAASQNWFAGVVVDPGPCARGAAGDMSIAQPGYNSLAQVWTDQSCAVGVTRLTVQAGSYAAGGDCEGPVIAMARQTVDRSTTNGVVLAELYDPPKNIPFGATHTAAGRGFSPLIWGPYEDTIQRIMLGDITLGAVVQEDFIGGLGNVGTTGDYAGKWLATIPTSGTVTYGTTGDGTIILTAGGADDQGPQIQLQQPFCTPAASKTILFECRAKVSAITQEQLFFGLATVDTAIFASGIIDTTNAIGFLSQTGVTAATKLDLWSEKATVAEDSASVATMASDTYFKVGFVVSGVTSLTGYVDGAAVSNGEDIVIATHLPVAAMAPAFVCMYENAAITCTIDWVRVAYLNA